jgi:hypothetical protein
MKILSPLHPIRAERLSQYIKRLPGLVAYYPLNENEGAVAYNQAPATKGTLNGTIPGATLKQDGKVGKAYSFDGVDDEIAIGNFGIFDGSKEFSLIAMFNPDVLDKKQRIICLQGEATVIFTFADGPANEIFSIRCNQLGTSWHTPVESSVNVVENWVIGIITYSPVSGWKLYKQGILEDSNAEVSAIIADNHAKSLIASDSGAFDGKMQHISIVNKTLTPAQILKMAKIAGF